MKNEQLLFVTRKRFALETVYIPHWEFMSVQRALDFRLMKITQRVRVMRSTGLCHLHCVKHITTFCLA